MNPSIEALMVISSVLFVFALLLLDIGMHNPTTIINRYFKKFFPYLIITSLALSSVSLIVGMGNRSTRPEITTFSRPK